VLIVLSVLFRPGTKPLVLISAACVIYGYLMKPLGLILSTLFLVFISAFAGHEFKWKEVTILYVILIVFSLLVFVKGLTLPFPICPAFMETCPIR
jgi:Tripartite tricarboxylate transporter TctB family